MPLLEEKVYTIDDIYALPEGERAELIDGHIYYMAPPNRTHQKISMELSARILEYIRSHKGKCEVYAAPFAVYLDDTTSTLCRARHFSDFATRINWMIKAAMVHQTGLLRLFLLQVNEWTIIRSFLNTEQQV